MIAPLPLAAIELGSAWMLGWIAAAGIPLALHLLRRRRQQEIKWAAVELLLQAIQQNSRTVKIEGWLLLLLRMLVLVLLGIALARPLLLGSSTIDAALTEPPRLWVLVLDASYSMNYTIGPQSLWQQAQNRANDVIQQAGPRDAFLLLQMANPPQAIIGQPVFDAARVSSELNRLKCTDAGARLTSCLELVRQTLDDARQVLPAETKVELLIFSDMGRDTWQAAVDGDARSMLQQLSAQYPVRLEALSIDQPANLALTDFEAEAPLVMVGRPLSCSATLHNFSAEPALRVPVQFLSNGSTVHTEFVDCPAGQSHRITASLQPPTGRNWHLSVQLPDDALHSDNRRDLVISIRNQVQVVTIEATNGAARLINLSLSPTSGNSVGNQRRSISVETWNVLQLPARDLSSVDAVILVDLPTLDSPSVIKLREYVEGGGALLALLGPATNLAAWNAANDSLSQLFGFTLDAPAAPGDWQVDPLGYNSPIARPFANYLDSGLLTTPIFQYWKLNKPATDQEPQNLDRTISRADWLIDLGLTNGDALIMRRPQGAGWLAAMLSAPDSGAGLEQTKRSWNAIATWPSFVPIMQKLVETLVGGGDIQHNVVVGQPLRGWLPHSSRAEELVVQRPDNSQSRLTVPAADGNARPAWIYTQADRAGLYQVSKAEKVSDTTVPVEQLFAVNVEATQSDMLAIALEDLPVTRPVDQPVTSGSRQVETDRRPNEFLTKLALGGLLGVLALESLLAWHLGRRLS